MLIFFICSIALSQSQPKVGLTAVEFYFEEKPIWHEDIREPWHFIEIATNTNQYISNELRFRLRWEKVHEIPFELSYKLEDYLELAEKEKFDVLLLYTIQYEPILDGIPLEPIIDEVRLDGELMIVETRDKWGYTSMPYKGMQGISEWIIKMSKEAKKAVEIHYFIKSDPTGQMCYVDGSHLGPTPIHFPAFRVIGHDTSIEVYFDLDKVCRRKIETIEHEGQIIDKEFKPSDSTEPPCEVHISQE